MTLVGWHLTHRPLQQPAVYTKPSLPLSYAATLIGKCSFTTVDGRAHGPVERCQRRQDQRGKQQDPYAEARCRCPREHCAGQESPPDACQEESTVEMCIPRSLTVAERSMPDRLREVAPKLAQRPGHEGQAH